MRIDTAIEAASRQLEAVSDSPRLDAELMVARTIDVARSYLFAHPEDTLDEAARERLEDVVSRRLAGEPMAYITGTKEFWSLELMVSPATLVPRPDSERVVELALEEIPVQAKWNVLDLGTGGGAIALAIAYERRTCLVTATDVSPDALLVARENVRQLELDNVEVLEGSWTEPVLGRHFEIIVSNPPYVADNDEALEALKSEPAIALTCGPDGLDAIRILASECPAILADGGLLLFEHGADQNESIHQILEAAGWIEIANYRDYAGLPRVTSARRK